MQLLRLLKLPAINLILFRFFPTEAAMILLYSLTWIVPSVMIRLDGGIVDGLTWGMFLQFIFGHSAVGITMARHLAKRPVARRIAVSAAGAFYLLFIAGFAFSTGSYLLVPVFLISLAGAFREPEEEEDAIMKGVFYPFFTIMILLLSSASIFIPVPEFGFGEPFPIEASSMGENGEIGEPQNVMLWGILYYTLLWQFRRFWERKVVGNKAWFLKR